MAVDLDAITDRAGLEHREAIRLTPVAQLDRPAHLAARLWTPARKGGLPKLLRSVRDEESNFEMAVPPENFQTAALRSSRIMPTTAQGSGVGAFASGVKVSSPGYSLRVSVFPCCALPNADMSATCPV